MSRLKINLEAIERDCNANAEGFSADGGVRVGSLLVSSEGVRDSAGHYYELSLNDFDVVPEAEGGFLGRGSSGSVRRAIHRRTGTVVALKEIKVTGKAHMSEIRRELETLHAGDCATPNLVNFYGAFTHEGSVFIAMEAMDGSLQEVAKPLPLPVLACMTRQMLKGLVYLHRTRHLMHRDLKPSNVLYNSRTGDIKISDFGVSSFLECTKADAHSFVGTVTYMSPERLHGDSYSYGADIWSLGLVVAELALGVCPFAGLRGESSEGRFWALIQHLNSLGPALELPADMDPNLADFINACVKKQPEQRATCSELLTHAFIKRYAAAAAGSPVPPPPPPGNSTSGVAASSQSMLSSPHALRAGLLPASLSAPPVGFPSGLSRSPIVSGPAVRAFDGLHESDNSGCGSGPASLQCAASPSTSSAATSSPQERHEGDADENFADHAVIQQWLRARAARHRSRRHCHSSSRHCHSSSTNRNARASPRSDSTNEGREGKMGGSGTADTLSNAGERAPPLPAAAAAGPAEGENRSPDCDSGDSGSAYVSPDETAGHQHHFDSQQLQGEPSVNLDDELDKLLL